MYLISLIFVLFFVLVEKPLPSFSSLEQSHIGKLDGYIKSVKRLLSIFLEHIEQIFWHGIMIQIKVIYLPVFKEVKK